MTAFCGLGDWRGTAEVYDGDGRFVGNGVDQRHARSELDDGRIRIALSFVGPFKLSGHYVIADKGTHRVYQGPANVGMAEAIGPRLVDADHYWPDVGLSQRLFLMVLPDEDKQLSLALLSRGERLAYVVVGENDKVSACATDGTGAPPAFVPGASIDLARDATAGRGALLLHRPGRWRGILQAHDATLSATHELAYEERVSVDGEWVRVQHHGGAFAPEPVDVTLRSDGWCAWASAGPLVGSYSLAGGRALSGTFQCVARELRIWRREVVSHDGSVKAVVHNLYRGGVRVGVQHGVLRFEAA